MRFGQGAEIASSPQAYEIFDSEVLDAISPAAIKSYLTESWTLSRDRGHEGMALRFGNREVVFGQGEERAPSPSRQILQIISQLGAVEQRHDINVLLDLILTQVSLGLNQNGWNNRVIDRKGFQPS